MHEFFNGNHFRDFGVDHYCFGESVGKPLRGWVCGRVIINEAFLFNVKGFHEGFAACEPVSVTREPVGQKVAGLKGEDWQAFIIIDPCVFKLEFIHFASIGDEGAEALDSASAGVE